MGSPHPPSWGPPRALSEKELREAYRSYERGLARLSPEQLMAEADRVAALIQSESQRAMTSLLLQERTSSLDRLDLASDPMEAPSGGWQDRPSPRSPASTSEPPWVALSGNRIGPRLAAKLVVASARAQSKRSW